MSFSGSEVRYRTHYNRLGEWILDTFKWLKWELTGQPVAFDGKKWDIHPYERYVSPNSSESSRVIVTGKVFANGKWSTTYNRQPKQQKRKFEHVDAAIRISGYCLAPSGKYAACVLSTYSNLTRALIRVFDFQNMTTSIYSTTETLPLNLNCSPVFLDDDTLCIVFYGVKDKNAVFVIHLQSKETETILNKTRQSVADPHCSKGYNIDALLDKRTIISDYMPLDPWPPLALDGPDIYGFLSIKETLSLATLIRQNGDQWRTVAAVRYLNNLEDKRYIPNRIVAISYDESIILFVYINMLILYDVTAHGFQIIEVTDQYLGSDYSVFISPDGAYVAITSSLTIRILRISDRQRIWQTLRPQISRARTIPIGFSEDSLRFYIGYKMHDGSLVTQNIVYVESGLECHRGCSAAANELALTTAESNSCDEAILFFNYITGKKLYSWRNWFVNLDGCDFRGAVLQEDIADVIEDNGGIVK